VIGCAVLIDARSPLGAGPCFKAVADAKLMPGVNVPQCEPWGDFKVKQCHASTGYCWCVDALGTKIAGTAKASWEGEPNCKVKRSSPPLGAGPCFKAVADAKLMPGVNVPQCEPWGDFKVKQCHASTGYCWCVDALGTKIAGTAKASWEGEPNCKVKRSTPPLGAGPCFKAVDDARLMPGANVPQCEPWGDFKKKQCNASTGYCWCVDTLGTKIAGTEKAFWEGEIKCA